jgi:ribosome-interacting GTPase 1
VLQCPLTHLDADICKAVLSEYRIHNADVSLRYDATVDDLIDVIEGNRVYIPCLYALNKIDQLTLEELDVIDKIPHYVPISAHLEWNLDGLLEKTWEYLDLTRMYGLHSSPPTATLVSFIITIFFFMTMKITIVFFTFVS